MIRFSAKLFFAATLLAAPLTVRAQEEDLPEGSEPAQTATAAVQQEEPPPQVEVGMPPETNPAEEVAQGGPKEELDPVLISRPRFSEDGTGLPSVGWKIGFHGYARMPLRFKGGFAAPRPPYLVDDNYYLSGFGYTRVNESEYAELHFSFEHEWTRFVVGIHASQFSDWSETTLQGQQGIATAFVEHTWLIVPEFKLGLRAGMFWDRYGYSAPYDTYLLGRMHVAGARIHARAFDMFFARAGFGAHADLINANQGFTPAAWLNGGVDLEFLEASLFYASSWTKDSEREFSIVENGSISVTGAEVRAGIPYVGSFWSSLAFYRARSALFTAPALELLHSTGGRGLTQNFLGQDSDNGTGEFLVGSFTLTWEPERALAAAAGARTGRYLRGLDINFFGMFAQVASNQASENPFENFHERLWIKWGFEPVYRPPFKYLDWMFVGLRYDRVILDKDHESLSFRAITPRFGVAALDEPKLEIFVAYTSYSYGENVRLRPNQIPGDRSVTTPDENVFKLQAQIVW